VVIYTIGVFLRPRLPRVSADRDGSRLDGLGIDYKKQRAYLRFNPPLPTLAGFEFIAKDVASHDGSRMRTRLHSFSGAVDEID